MDRFNSVIKHSKYEVRKVPPVPGSNKSPYISIILSSDMFIKFLGEHWNLKTNLPVKCTIYDEQERTNSSEVTTIRMRLLEILNRLNIEKVDFKLSDDALRDYNRLMNIVRWKHSSNTTLDISINRHPFNNATLNLEESKGKLLLPEEAYLWLSDYSIRCLNGIIDTNEIQEILKLKRVVEAYCSKVEGRYHLERLSDLDKLYIAYNYMKSPIGLNIGFAASQTYRDVNGIQRLNRSNSGWESKAIGTYEHRQGVCEGQARLLKALINNPYMRVDSEVISGRIPTGESHAWLGIVSNNELYQACLTMRGILSNLDESGYIPNSDDVYSKIYPHATISEKDARTLRMHLRSLTRK